MPRTLPWLASMRWIVGTETPAQLGQGLLVDAEQRPAARICAEVIKEEVRFRASTDACKLCIPISQTSYLRSHFRKVRG